MELKINIEELRPVLRQIVREVLAEIEQGRADMNGQLAFDERTAASLLGLKTHVLADQRRRGRISFSRICKGRIRYTRADLASYLARHREGMAAR